MNPLEPVQEHRTIPFSEDVAAHFENAVWTDPDQIVVEGGVMELAQREAVRDDRFASRMGVGKDVRGVE